MHLIPSCCSVVTFDKILAFDRVDSRHQNSPDQESECIVITRQPANRRPTRRRRLIHILHLTTMAAFNSLSDEQLSHVYTAELIPEVAALIDGEHDFIINTANVAAILYHGLKKVSIHHMRRWMRMRKSNRLTRRPSLLCTQSSPRSSTRAPMQSIGPAFI